MDNFFLDIMGSEWIIIIFVALVVLLGTNKLPEVSKKLGKVIGEYNKAKDNVQKQFNGIPNSNLEISGPVQNERQKLETIAKSLGVDSNHKSEQELRDIISSRIGKLEEKDKEK